MPRRGSNVTQFETPMRQRVRAALRAAVRASAPRPASAKRAAKDFDQGLWPALGSEIRWAFTPPRTWMSGVAANLFLAVVFLAVHPLTFHGQQTRHYHNN